MILKTIKSSVARNLINIPGWRTKRKIIVIESDDWGAIRMPSIDVYSAFLKKGYRVDLTYFNRLDALESNDDLISLFEVLQKYRDSHGNHPVFTANILVANPDFNKIRDSDFKQYYYEHVIDTLKKYPNHDNVYNLWHEGIKKKLFLPQFHGREHLNIKKWMKALSYGSENMMFTFKSNTTYSGSNDYSFMGSFEQSSKGEFSDHIEIISDGLKIFKETFGYSSKTFIAPCYIWNSDLEETLYMHGVHYIQSSLFQELPYKKYYIQKRRIHYIGQKNKHNQLYLVRNCIFEPALINKIDFVNYTLNSIAIAFKWSKPAIISSHRINYIGYLNENNRRNNLNLLSDLLQKILIKWPDVEFMTSDKLGDLIDYDTK